MRPHDEMNDELTPAERAAFTALPREREPARLLEERTVRALRDRELLRAPSRQPRRFRFAAGWMAGAAAAAIALFMTGLAAGQYLGARQVRETIAQAQVVNAQQAAQLVQQTGSAYVNALASFASVADTSKNPRARQQGREVAAQMLRAAADELVRINPDDPVASSILAAFDRARTQTQQGTQADTTGKERVVWF